MTAMDFNSPPKNYSVRCGRVYSVISQLFRGVVCAKYFFFFYSRNIKGSKIEVYIWGLEGEVERENNKCK